MIDRAFEVVATFLVAYIIVVAGSGLIVFAIDALVTREVFREAARHVWFDFVTSFAIVAGFIAGVPAATGDQRVFRPRREITQNADPLKSEIVGWTANVFLFVAFLLSSVWIRTLY